MNPFDRVREYFGNLFKPKKITVYNNQIPTPAPVDKSFGIIPNGPMGQPGAKYVPVIPPQTENQVQTPTQQYPDLTSKIRSGFTGQVGQVPALDYVDEFVNAAQQYPIFKENPYLMPQVAILETTGGKYITRPNNLINYGIRDPKINDLFRQVGIRDALKRSLKEIGQTGKTYERFRTGKKLSDTELQDFARTYEPENASYYENLAKGIKFFEEQ